MPGTLYIVATPIGNLQDVTARGLEVLRSVNVIACEDTRHTQKLLTHFRISTRTVSYHEHNEHERAEDLVDRMLAGESVAVVSDAGTPALSDPGLIVVGRAREAGINVISIPGPCAFVTAAAASGLATDSIFFGGFLPAKKGERVKRLAELESIPATLIFYEAPHRLVKSLADCLDVLGDRQAVVAREITKIHEEYAVGLLSELVEKYSSASVRGEIVLLIERGSKEVKPAKSDADLPKRVAELEGDGIDRKSALKQAAREFGLSKSEAYRRLENLKK